MYKLIKHMIVQVETNQAVEAEMVAAANNIANTTKVTDFYLGEIEIDDV